MLEMGFLAQHVTAGRQRLHGRLVVVTAILHATGGHVRHVRRQRAQHGFGLVKGRHAKGRSGGVSPLTQAIADAHQIGQRVRLQQGGVAPPDGAHADDADAQHQRISGIS